MYNTFTICIQPVITRRVTRRRVDLNSGVGRLPATTRPKAHVLSALCSSSRLALFFKHPSRAAPMTSKVLDTMATRNGRMTTRRKRQRSSSPPNVKKRPTTRKSRTTTSDQPRPSRSTPTLLNPLPSPPPHERPSWRLFCWGAGDSGQLGMGEGSLESTLAKPRRNLYVENQGKEGLLGGPEAGLESIAAGSLHSAWIDENGTVS